MTRKYRVGRNPKNRGRKVFVVMACSMVIIGGLGGFLVWDTQRNSRQEEVMGASRTVTQAGDKDATEPVNVNEPFFSFSLPPDWKLKERIKSPNEQSITWQATKKGEDNRWFKIYFDTIPADLPVNRLLPVDIVDNTLSYRQVSDNCANFTTVPNPQNKTPLPSKWQGVDFICDVPNFVQNKVGVNAPGALNAATITGPTKGKHKYFFVYTDHNIQPDYTILYTIVRSFRAL